MPPTAAATAATARRGSRRSPATNSRLSSSPATKKKIASRPSAAQVPRVRSRCSDAGPTAVSRSGVVRVRPRRVRPDQRDHRGQPAGARRRRSPCAGRRRCGAASAEGAAAEQGRAGLVTGAAPEGSAIRTLPTRLPGAPRLEPTGRAGPATRATGPASPRGTPSSVCTVARPADAGEQPDRVGGAQVVDRARGDRGRPAVASAARANSRAIVVPGRMPGLRRRGVQHAAGRPHHGRRRPLEQLPLQRR